MIDFLGFNATVGCTVQALAWTNTSFATFSVTRRSACTLRVDAGMARGVDSQYNAPSNAVMLSWSPAHVSTSITCGEPRLSSSAAVSTVCAVSFSAAVSAFAGLTATGCTAAAPITQSPTHATVEVFGQPAECVLNVSAWKVAAGLQLVFIGPASISLPYGVQYSFGGATAHDGLGSTTLGVQFMALGGPLALDAGWKAPTTNGACAVSRAPDSTTLLLTFLAPADCVVSGAPGDLVAGPFSSAALRRTLPYYALSGSFDGHPFNATFGSTFKAADLTLSGARAGAMSCNGTHCTVEISPTSPFRDIEWTIRGVTR